MKKEILCEKCKPGIEKIAKDCESYSEAVDFVKGIAVQDYCCDQCAIDIPAATMCWASTIRFAWEKPSAWHVTYIVQQN